MSSHSLARLAAIALAAGFAVSAVGGAPPAPAADERQAPLAPPPVPPARATDAFLGMASASNAKGWGRLMERSDAPGVLVLVVLPGSPALAAGLVRGDVVTAVDGEPVRDDARLAAVLKTSPSPLHRLGVVNTSGEARTVVVTAIADPADADDQLLAQVAANPSPANRFAYARTTADRAAAVSVLSDLVREFPDFADAYAAKAERLLEKAGAEHDLFGARGDVAKATTKALELDPDSLAVELAAARVTGAFGNAPQTARFAATAIAIDDHDPRAHQLLGTALLQMRRPAEALPELHRSVSLDSFNQDVLRALSACYTALGQPALAAQTDRLLAGLQLGAGDVARQTAPGHPGQAMLALGLVAAGVLVDAAVSRVRDSRRPAPDARQGAGRPPTAAFEFLGAVGLFSVAVPFLGARLGLNPGARRVTEVADHIVPGLVLVAVCAGAAGLPRRRAHDAAAYGPLAGTAGLAGLWITAAHLGLIGELAGGHVAVDAAMFHMAAGPAALAIAAAALRRSYAPAPGSARGPTASAESPQA